MKFLGVLGMCNDTSAIIDFAVRGETSAYPLLGTGRYLNHIFNYFLALKEVIQGKPNMKSALFDLNKLIKAIAEMPTDIHVAPSTIEDTAARFCATHSNCIFQKTEESKEIMKEMANRVKQYSENTGLGTNTCLNDASQN